MSEPRAETCRETAAAVPGVSVVFPVCNEAGNLKMLHERVQRVFHQAGISYELVFVDDGSQDESLAIIKTLRERDPRVRYVSLSRSFGQQAALIAGISLARGEAIVMMDADLQHPPELIPEMLRLWREGHDVVYTTKRNTHMPRLWRWQMRLFYALISKLSGLRLSFGQSDFRLIDRKVADVLRSLPEYRKFLRGLISWVGFKQAGLEYTVSERREGRSKYSYRSFVAFALDGVFSFSVVPLRLLLIFGVLIWCLTVPYIVWVLILGVRHLMGGAIDLPPGWATISVSVIWLGSVQLVAIGLIGEYAGRIYDQTKGRPEFIIRERSDGEVASPAPSDPLEVERLHAD